MERPHRVVSVRWRAEDGGAVSVYVLRRVERVVGPVSVGDIIEWPFRSGVPRIVTEIRRDEDHVVLEVPT